VGACVLFAAGLDWCGRNGTVRALCYRSLWWTGGGQRTRLLWLHRLLGPDLWSQSVLLPGLLPYLYRFCWLLSFLFGFGNRLNERDKKKLQEVNADTIFFLFKKKK
jgi:hypothetical protein